MSECSSIINQWSLCICLSVCVCVCRLQPEQGEPGASVIFRSLLPAEVSRRTVSSTFQRLLGEFVCNHREHFHQYPIFLSFLFFLFFHIEYLSAGKLSAQQEVPYGDILILPGPSYEEELRLI